MSSSRVWREKIAVRLALRNGIDALDAALEHHANAVNVQSPATALLDAGGGGATVFTLAPAELLVVYTVDGVRHSNGDPCVFVLDRCTMEQHRHHAATRSTVRYVVLKAAAPPRDGNDAALDTAVEMLFFEASPALASVTHASASAVVRRTSPALTHALGVAEDVQRGLAKADTQGGMTSCCCWVSETMALVEEAFGAGIAAAETTIAAVEAFTVRYTALQAALDFVRADGSIFSAMRDALAAECPAQLQWAQRIAALEVAMESARLAATWIAVLARSAMTLRLQTPAATQSLDGTDAATATLLGALLLLIAAFPGQSVLESDEGIRTLERFIVPQVAADLVCRCEELLALHSCFDVGADVIPKSPAVCTDAVKARFACCVKSLKAASSAWAAVVAVFERVFPHRLSPSAKSCFAAATCASDRCEELVDMCNTIDRATYGLMTPEVACLYRTLHISANTFSLLRPEQAPNWELLRRAFNKALALKLAAVEAIPFEPIAPPQREAPPRNDFFIAQTDAPNPTTLSLQTRPAVAGGAGASTAALLEERAVLTTRVAQMSQELTTARQLIASLQAQLGRATTGLEAAQELNMGLMAELTSARLAVLGAEKAKAEGSAPAVARSSLVTRLANERIEAASCGSHIEDEILAAL